MTYDREFDITGKAPALFELRLPVGRSSPPTAVADIFYFKLQSFP
jgi:hypothetical protein